MSIHSSKLAICSVCVAVCFFLPTLLCNGIYINMSKVSFWIGHLRYCYVKNCTFDYVFDVLEFLVYVESNYAHRRNATKHIHTVHQIQSVRGQTIKQFCTKSISENWYGIVQQTETLIRLIFNAPNIPKKNCPPIKVNYILSCLFVWFDKHILIDPKLIETVHCVPICEYVYWTWYSFFWYIYIYIFILYIYIHFLLLCPFLSWYTKDK